jgi:hypothetical protein
VSYRQGKWAKKLLFSFLIFVLIIILLIAGVTIYVNKILTREKVLQLTQKYSQQFLDRNITFKDYSFNILKGIVLEGLYVEKNTNILHTTDLSIGEVNLSYNYKELLKLKLDINEIVIGGLVLEIDEKIINSELNYYKNKFKVTSKSKATNQSHPKKESTLNISLLGLSDSKITFIKKKKKIILDINEIEFENGSVKSLSKNLLIDYLGTKITLKGESLLQKDNSTFQYDIRLPAKGIHLTLNSMTSNFSKFKLWTKLNFQKNLYQIQSTVIYSSNKIRLPYMNIKDKVANLQIRSGIINLKSLNAWFSLKGELNQITEKYVSRFIVINQLNYLANLKLNTAVKMNLKYPGNLVVNGDIDLIDSKLKVKNEDFYFKKNLFQIKDNHMNVINGSGQYKDHQWAMNISKPNLINFTYPFTVGLKTDSLNLNQFITMEKPIRSRLKNVHIKSSLNIKKRKITFTDIQAKGLNGTIKSSGFFDFQDSNKLQWEFKNDLLKIDIQNIAKQLELKQKLQGLVNGDLMIRGNISDKIANLTYFKGQMKTTVDVDDIKNIETSIYFKSQKNNIQIYNSYVIYDYNKVWINGTYNLKTKSLDLVGENNKLFLKTIKALNNKYIGRLEFDFKLHKKLNSNAPFKGNIVLRSPTITFDNMKFNKLKGYISVQSNKYAGNITIHDFYKGVITSKLTRDADKNIKFSAEGKNIKGALLMKDWNNYDISGIVNIKFNYNITGENRQGDIVFNAVKGELIGNQFQVKITDLFNGLLDYSHILYKNITVKAELRNEIVKFNQFDVICTDQEYRVSGMYNLNTKEKDFLLKMRLREDFLMDAPNFAQAYVADDDGNWSIVKPIEWKGVDKNPQIR